MSRRKITKLTDIKFTEISAVDRPANDHATLEHVELLKRYGLMIPPELEALMANDLPAELEPHKGLVRKLMEKAVGALYKRKFTQAERDEAADKGHAMPDGSYPINNTEDLHNAVQAFGRNPTEAVKNHIKRRAKELGAEGTLPDKWEKSLGVSIAKQILDNLGPEWYQKVEEMVPPQVLMGQLRREGILHKSLYTVGELAMMVCSLDCMVQCLAGERTAEGDVNPVVEELSNLRDELGDALVALTQHEVKEVQAEKPGEQQPAAAVL